MPIAYPYYDSDFSSTSEINTCTTYSRVLRKRLVEISSNENIGKILFNNTSQHPDPSINNYRLVDRIDVFNKDNILVEKSDFDYHFTANDRVFLNSVTSKNPAKQHSFSYIDKENLPERFSFSQDFWGYYNGKGNQSLLPNFQTTHPVFNIATNRLANRDPDHSYSKKGLLEKIEYPTKGYSIFDYEANTYSGFTATNSSYTYENVALMGMGSNATTFSTGSINGDQSIIGDLNFSVIPYVDEDEGCIEPPNNIVYALVKVFNMTDDPINPIYDYNFSVNEGVNDFSIQIPLSPDKIYKIELSNPNYGPRCVEANSTLRYSTVTSAVQNIETGGNRVKYAKDFDSNGALKQYKRYHYTSKEDLNVSSGDATKKGLGHISVRREYRIIDPAFGGLEFQDYISLKSTGNFPLVNSGSNNIYYKKVTISNGSDDFIEGGEEHEFIINRDRPGQVLLGQKNLTIPNFSNFGWNNSLEKKVTYFKKPTSNEPYIILNEKENFYKLDSVMSAISNYYIAPYYNYVGWEVPDPTYKCKEEDLIKRTMFVQCQTDHTHRVKPAGLTFAILYGGVPGPITTNEIRCRTRIPPSNNVFVMYRNHKCYGLKVDSIVSYPEKIRNLNVFKYKTFSNWHYKYKTVNKVYDLDGLNPIETMTNYFYENYDHLQLTRTETTDSKGNLIKTKTDYPQDNLTNLTAEASLAIDSLIAQHRIATPIQAETTVTKGGVALSKTTQRTNFKDWGLNGAGTGHIILPEFVQTLKGENNLENRITYHDYDDQGNPLEVSKTDGTHIYYIWGYNQQYPVAKIENATQAEVGSFNLGDGGLSTAQADALRASLPNAQVTTYTYDPLIGVTSITDPRGYTIYYEYDEFNRLKQVKDAEGNIVNKNEYHYKN